MNQIILKLTGLDKAEFNRAMSYQVILFLIVTSLLLLKPTVNSVFISSLGVDALPIAYIMTAIFAIVGFRLYQKLTSKHAITDTIRQSLLLTIGLLVSFGLVFQFHLGNAFFLFAMYVFISLYGLLTTSQFWLYTKATHTVRQAKRTYGLIGSGGIAGGIFGGYIASLLTRFIPVESIIFVAAITLAACMPLYHFVFKKNALIKDNTKKTEQDKEENEKPLKIILNSKLLSFNALIILLSVLAAKLIDYQYRDLASQFAGNKQDLGAFFGVWLSNISIISLLIQLFLTKKVLKRFGVTNSLLFMPGGLMMAAIVFLFLPELMIAVLMRLIDGSMKNSINKSAKELVYIPIPLHESKMAKSYIDVVVDSVATGLAGFLLYFVLSKFAFKTNFIALLVIVLIAAWVFVIFKLKKEYRMAYWNLANLSQYKTADNVEEQDKSTNLEGRHAQEAIEHIVQNGTEEQQIEALQHFKGHKTTPWSERLLPLLSSSSPGVRKRCLQVLMQDDSQDFSEQIEHLIDDKDVEVATYAFNYLTHNAAHDKAKHWLLKGLNQSNDIKRLAALNSWSAYLYEHGQDASEAQFQDELQQLIDQLKSTENKTDSMALLGSVIYMIGQHNGYDHLDLIARGLNCNDKEVNRVSLEAIQKLIRNKNAFIPVLLKQMDIRLIEVTLQQLLDLGDKEERLDKRAWQELLAELVACDNQLKTGQAYTITEEEENQKLLQLVYDEIEALRQHIRSAIARLLELHYGRDKIEPVLRVLETGQSEEAVNALEYVQELFDLKTRQLISPIIDEELQRVQGEPALPTSSIESKEKWANQLLACNQNRLTHYVSYYLQSIKE